MSELLLLPRPKRLETLGADGAPAEAAPQLRHEPGLGSEAFRLDIGGGSVRLHHGDASGLRFGLQCLAQIRSQSGERRVGGGRLVAHGRENACLSAGAQARQHRGTQLVCALDQQRSVLSTR